MSIFNAIKTQIAAAKLKYLSENGIILINPSYGQLEELEAEYFTVDDLKDAVDDFEDGVVIPLKATRWLNEHTFIEKWDDGTEENKDDRSPSEILFGFTINYSAGLTDIKVFMEDGSYITLHTPEHLLDPSKYEEADDWFTEEMEKVHDQYRKGKDITKVHKWFNGDIVAEQIIDGHGDIHLVYTEPFRPFLDSYACPASGANWVEIR